MASLLPLYRLVKCSNCGGDVILQGAHLICKECSTRYDFKNLVPDMLPLAMNFIAGDVDKRNDYVHKFPVAPYEVKYAGQWLAKQLQIDEENIKWGKEEVFRHQLAYVLKLSPDMGLGYQGKRLMAGMLGARNMSFKYKSKIADQLSASGLASGYEAYEDILLRRQIDNAVNTGDVALIEIGSGVGRLLHEYGTCMSSELSDSGLRYRRFAPAFYSYKPKYEEHLKLLIGIDFEQRMIDKSVGWLERSGLSYLIRSRILHIRALATTLNIDLDPGIKKVVTILFQTLGNQLGERLQIAMLKKAKEFASPNGIVFVSVFNKEFFKEQAESYYNSIKASVGRIAYCNNGVFLSDKGVFSVWFEANQLKRLFKLAGMENVTVLDEQELKVFPEYSQYISIQDQKKYKKRAIIAVAPVATHHFSKARVTL